MRTFVTTGYNVARALTRLTDRDAALKRISNASALGFVRFVGR